MEETPITRGTQPRRHLTEVTPQSTYIHHNLPISTALYDYDAPISVPCSSSHVRVGASGIAPWIRGVVTRGGGGMGGGKGERRRGGSHTTVTHRFTYITHNVKHALPFSS